MFNKATDAVSKMTIKMNESDIVSIRTPLGCPCSGSVCSSQSSAAMHLWESALGLPISVV